MRENKNANMDLSIQRSAKVTITLDDDQVCVEAWVEPKWDATDSPSALELQDKYLSLAKPVLVEKRSQSISDSIDRLKITKSVRTFGFASWWRQLTLCAKKHKDKFYNPTFSKACGI